MANPFFNAKYYLEKNADVAAAVGDDADLAEQHYFLYGASEAADGTIVDRKPAPWFDIQFYANSREDLADVPAEQLFLHFVIHGMREGLSPMEGVEFDADTYLAANEDLVEGLNIADPESLTEDEALLLQQHFFAHGYIEGREGGPDIPGWDEGGDLAELAAALEAKQVADQAVVEYLKNAPELTLDAGTVPAGEAKATDIRTNLTEAVAAVDGKFNDAPDGFASMEADLQDEFIAAEQALLNAAVSAAKAGQPANLEELLAVAEAAREARVAAAAAVVEAEEDSENIIAAFEAYHNLSEGDLVTDLTAETYEATENYSGQILLIGGKFYVGQDGTDAAVPFDELEEMEATNLQADVLAAIAAVDAATAARESAQAAQENAVLDVYLAVNPSVDPDDVVDPVYPIVGPDFNVTYGEDGLTYDGGALSAVEAGNLEAALTARKQFADAVADLIAARELNDGLVALEAEAADAKAAIENSPEDEDAPGLGITLVELDTDGFTVTATADTEELFLFNEEVGGSIAGFGEEHLLFFGSKYTFVELAEDFDFAGTRTGDNDVLEIFYQVQGSNTVFYVENDAGAAHDLDLSNITTVTLTGVTGVDVAEDLGFVGLTA